jgi:hypothetical protein
MKKVEQEDKGMGREQKNIMLQIARLLQEESLITEEESREAAQLIEQLQIKE